MFNPVGSRSIRWRALPNYGQGDGLCEVHLDGRTGDIAAHGMAIGAIDGRRFAASFLIQCDEQWRTRRLAVETTDGRRLEIRSDSHGNWRSGAGEPVPALAGLIDIDLQASPLTNTLPIRRLALTETMGPVDLTMVYIPFDSFEPYPFAQRYTCLEDGRRFLYENADGSFSAELAVDADGLVLDYPGLFERLPG